MTITSAPGTRVGVIVVHGIGEQRRFEHLDAQVRDIAQAFQARPNTKVTVEILSYPAASFQAEQWTWQGAPTVIAHIEDSLGARTVIEFHEVWWADVNEPYSLFKQLRFWAWTLGIWLYPGKERSALPTASSVRPPQRPGGTSSATRVWVRTRLFFIASVAVLGAASIGMLTFLAERLLKLKPPIWVRVFVNYVAGVKLYNQKQRMGIGFPAQEQDFLDSLNEPPRVSVRRRMIRTLMDVASRQYDRWYVLAHSLGSVVAFNGLMETAYTWPGYFNSAQWDKAVPDLAGPAAAGWSAPTGTSVPRRPVWADKNSVAYRSRIFQHFRGLLTFGCPLEKFAAIWPARVPISKEPAFRPGTQWLNVYDPVDPVSGVLRAFDSSDATCCPMPVNIGYAASPFLLLSHVKYLSGADGTDTLSDGVAEWLLTGNAARISPTSGPRWFSPDDLRHHWRSAWAWLTWVIVVCCLAALGGLALPLALNALATVNRDIATNLASLVGHAR